MSYTPMQLFIDWMTQYATTNGYTLTRGMWGRDKYRHEEEIYVGLD